MEFICCTCGSVENGWVAYKRARWRPWIWGRWRPWSNDRLWLPCPCGANLHHHWIYPCPVCDRVDTALAEHEKQPAMSKDQVIAEWNQFLLEHNQPALSPEEITLIHKYPTKLDWWAAQEEEWNARPLREHEQKAFDDAVDEPL